MKPHYRDLLPDPGPEEDWKRVFLWLPTAVQGHTKWLCYVEARRCFNWHVVWTEYREVTQ